MLVPLNNMSLTTAEKDDMVHVSLQLKNLLACFHPFLLSETEVVCDVSKTIPQPGETIRQSKITILPKCELPSHPSFYFFLRFRVSREDSSEQPLETGTML